MKILFLNQNYENEGTFHRCFFLGKHLVEIGHEVTIITISHIFPSYRINKKTRDSVEIVTLPTHSRKKDYLFYALRPFINSIYSLSREYDVLHAFTVAEPMTGIPAIFNKIKGRPIFVDWDDWYSRDGLANNKPFQSIMRPTMRLLEENVPKIADKVTVVSEALKNRAIDIGVDPNKIIKVPNGADVEFIKPLDREECRKKLNFDNDIDRKIILYMGRYNTALPVLISAFEKVLKEFPDALLILVGKIDIEYNKLTEYSSLFEKISASKNYLFVGAQPYKKIPLYLGAADVLTIPMENNNIERARSPIRLGDYLASGRAIVANNIGEVGHVLSENKCGLVANDENEFGERIIKILSDDELREKLEIRARNVAEEKFAWDIIARQFERLYT